MKEIELYFDDLVPEKKKELLKAMGLEKPEDINWDVFPLTTIVMEDIQEERNGILPLR